MQSNKFAIAASLALASVVSLFVLGVTTPNVAFADNLLVQRVGKEGAAMPRRGSTMATVEAQFGAPAKKHSAVGKPPITRWDYPGFSVYFEHRHVIDSVAAKVSESEMGAKPVAQPAK